MIARNALSAATWKILGDLGRGTDKHPDRPDPKEGQHRAYEHVGGDREHDP